MPDATSVPGRYPCSLNDRALPVDTASGEWRHVSAPMLRAQQDSSAEPSESSLTPDGLWRRSQDDWHFGAGQTFRDRDLALPQMFRSSKGIDVWTKYQFSLLADTSQALSSANTNLALVPAGTRLYTLDGTAVKYTATLAAPSTWTTVTGTGANSKQAICSDGYTIYFTDGTDVYSTNTTISTASVYNTLDCTVLAYVKGRLMAANANSVYNITSGTAPAALFSHSNAQFTWVGFAEGKTAIYAAGYSGDKSLIYRIRVKPDATTLDQPVIAGQLPDGEIIRVIEGYLGFIFLGTDKGARFCVPNVSGDLEIGPLISTTSAVRAFEGQDRYVWFGWTNYDGTSTGLGRINLTVFTEDGLPAYASDLMVTAQANVLSIASFGTNRVFAVSGNGIYYDSANKVSSGTLDTGDIGFGLPDTKTTTAADTRTVSLPAGATWKVSLSADGGAFTDLGTQSTTNNKGASYTTSNTQGERLELRFTLTRATDNTTGPTIKRWTLKAFPVWTDGGGEFIVVPFMLKPTVTLANNEQVAVAVVTERNAIKTLRGNRSLVTYKEGTTSYTVAVDDYEWRPDSQPDANGTYGGIMLTRLRVF